MSDLGHMLQLQLDMQRDSFKADPTAMGDEQRMEFIRWNVLALTDELHEMLAETGWKPWASSQHVNTVPAMNEMVDAWHFFMNLMLALTGVDDCELIARDFVGAYQSKHDVNRQRQLEGYDGITGKCPDCHRDITDLANMIDMSSLDDEPYTHFACTCGKVIR